MSAPARVSIAMIGVVFVAAACSGAVEQRSPTPALTTTQAATPTPTPSPTPASSTTPGPTPFGPGILPLDAGPHAAQVMGSGTYPGYTVVVPAGWYDGGGSFTVKYPLTDKPGPILGVSVWDVGKVFRDPCHWTGQAVDPGPSVEDLVAALVAQPLRHATKPADVTLAGYQGRYIEWSVPADMKSSTWTDFDACDVEPSDGHRNFNSWLGNGMGDRFQVVPGQVDRLWVLDIHGQRLLVDATYSPDTTQVDRAELGTILESLRFVTP